MEAIDLSLSLTAAIKGADFCYSGKEFFLKAVSEKTL